MKNISVVADESLRKEAIGLVHGLSKVDDVRAVYWTPKQFKDNESHVSGKNPIIFIGRNSESDPYIDLIKPMMNKHGVVWGYDGSKAAIIVKSEPTDSKAFSRNLEKHVEKAKEAKKKDNLKDAIGIAGPSVGLAVSSVLFFPAFLPFAVGGAIIALITGGLKKKERKKVKTAQYTYGLLSFTQDGLDEYLEQLN